jgi:hypothetical protein
MNSELTFSQFLAWETRSRDTIDVKTIYIDIAKGDHVAGVLLSQIVYWYLPSVNGGSKLRVERDGHLWIAKGRADWYEETRITARQFDRAVKILERAGIVVKETYKFAGVPKTHVRLVVDKFLDIWQSHSEPPETEKSTLPNGEVLLTETTEDLVLSKEESTMSSEKSVDTPTCYLCGTGQPVDPEDDPTGRCIWCLILDGWNYFMNERQVKYTRPVPRRSGTSASKKLRKKAEARWKDDGFRERWRLVLERCSISGHLMQSSWFDLEYFLRNEAQWKDLGGRNIDMGKFDSFDKQSHPENYASLQRWLAASKAGVQAASHAGWTQI